MQTARALKACYLCRSKKLKCSFSKGQTSCDKCLSLGVQCVFEEATRPSVRTEIRLQSMEEKIKELEKKIDGTKRPMREQRASDEPAPKRIVLNQPPRQIMPASPAAAPMDAIKMISNEKRSDIPDINQTDGQPADFLTDRTLTLNEARDYFRAFFQGCHEFVPIFDPLYDTMETMRRRSSVCFSAILVVGSRVILGASSPKHEKLKNRFYTVYSKLILFPSVISIELIQATVLAACYMDNGWQLIGNAVRLAKRAGLTKFMEEEQAFNELMDCSWKKFATARTWYFVYVMESVLSLGSGRLPDVSRRQRFDFRLLVTAKQATLTDARLLAQIDLVDIRAKYFKLLREYRADSELIPILDENQRELHQWYHDWLPRMTLPFQRDSLNVQLEHALLFSRSMLLRTLLDSQQSEISPEIQHILFEACSNAVNYVEWELSSSAISEHLRYAFDYTFGTAAFSLILILKAWQIYPHNIPTVVSLENCRKFYENMVMILGETHIYTKAVKKLLNEVEDRQTTDQLNFSEAIEWSWKLEEDISELNFALGDI